jgi:hypothetical protein
VRKLSALDPERAGEDWLHLFLVRPEDLDRVVTQHVAVQGYWVVDVLRSPVIEFQRCFFDGKELRRGRAYFVDKYYDSSDALIQKPETFRKWAQTVLRAIRQSLERKGSDYIGYDAKQWLSTGKGALID